MAGTRLIDMLKSKAADSSRRSAWEQFRSDEQLQHVYNVTPEELESLSRMAMLGNLASKHDYLFILKMMRARRHRY
jgi:hypothetical protein